MKPRWFWLLFVVACTFHALMSNFFNDLYREMKCQHQYSVYECRVMAVPVTPDGQPLDMSDPFHGEDE